jgi:hypothetical protein
MSVPPWRSRCDRPVLNAHRVNATDKDIAIDTIPIGHVPPPQSSPSRQLAMCSRRERLGSRRDPRRHEMLALAECMHAVALTSSEPLYHIFAASRFQKRKRNPAVGAMLLRWRKPKANPPFTCVNMTPA